MRENYRRKVIKLQEIGALCVNLTTIFIIYFLVTFTNMGYMDNILDNSSFFAVFIFLNSQGKTLNLSHKEFKLFRSFFQGAILFMLLFFDFNILEKLDVDEENCLKIKSFVHFVWKILLTLLLLTLVLVPPALMGHIVHKLYKQEEYFGVFAKETGTDGELMVNLIMLSQVNNHHLMLDDTKYWREVEPESYRKSQID